MIRLRQPNVHPSSSVHPSFPILRPSSSSSISIQPSDEANTAAALGPSSQRRIHQMLFNYISTIRKENFIDRLNQLLLKRVSSSPSSASSDIESYYSNRPELRNYTLGVEMDRDMDYTLILEDGQSISDKAAIRSHYFGIRESRQEEMSDQGSGTTKIDTEELLIRAANQSILADALMALTGSEEVLQQPSSMQSNMEEKKFGLVLPGPILSMTSVVEKCHFTIDLQHKKLETICVLAISVPVDDQRLVLARAILIAHFRPGRRRKNNQLHYAMQFVKAHHFPLSKALRDASVSLAKDQENLLSQSSSPTGSSSSSSSSSGSLEEKTIPMKENAKLFQRSFSLFR
mmetsp:Transcript_29119/g.61490  ORF Transcript_29119/g.61490 Transcript_29119/m.61490 type:complete len:345 (-) Transcript_29119:65-1099(-)|eukprot:CAMPEP_0183720256 /NCGR_PEP_ID=MMETSP0737-20130205/12925_1 /TAXON_ID=385413 /ORGANISM="Thalassiosira miniscula, Strain CCMP1093" /LENGTH=344 /DNA_ID=CAMNT_0025950097 /DNA_START=364 /DNA_END=1398 /DNA_ORIENTATION=-